MKKIVFFVLTIMTFFPFQAEAFLSGEELKEACAAGVFENHELMVSEENQEQIILAHKCLSYLDGIIQAQTYMNYSGAEPKLRLFCAPRVIWPDKTVEIINNYFAEKPESIKVYPYVLVTTALGESWPCVTECGDHWPCDPPSEKDKATRELQELIEKVQE